MHNFHKNKLKTRHTKQQNNDLLSPAHAAFPVDDEIAMELRESL